MNETKHWADQYRNFRSDTLEGLIYVAACYCRGEESYIREVGRVAFENKCGVWHAAWLVGGEQGACHCTPCSEIMRKLLAGTIYRVRVNKGGFAVMIEHGAGMSCRMGVLDWIQNELGH